MLVFQTFFFFGGGGGGGGGGDPTSSNPPPSILIPEPDLFCQLQLVSYAYIAELSRLITGNGLASSQ